MDDAAHFPPCLGAIGFSLDAIYRADLPVDWPA
jgi:hypothetical protein